MTRSTILALCKDGFLSLRQLAELLNRGRETIRDGLISPMVKGRVLELRYPDSGRAA